MSRTPARCTQVDLQDRQLLAAHVLGLDGVGRGAKWRVLNMLEKAGLISIDGRQKKSPIVTVNLLEAE